MKLNRRKMQRLWLLSLSVCGVGMCCVFLLSLHFRVLSSLTGAVWWEVGSMLDGIDGVHATVIYNETISSNNSNSSIRTNTTNSSTNPPATPTRGPTGTPTGTPTRTPTATPTGTPTPPTNDAKKISTAPRRPAKAANTTSISTNPPPFIRDALCGGCRWIMAKKVASKTCGSLIHDMATSRSMSLVEAARLVAQEKPICQACLPESCPNENDRTYWRYDVAAPTILNAWTHSLTSVPAGYRVPDDVLQPPDQALNHKLQTYFDNPKNAYPAKKYYFEYNPSIVVLPQNSRQDLPRLVRDAVYLASYRVSNLQNCFTTNLTLAMIGGNWDKKGDPDDMMGLAFLRSDMSIIHDMVAEFPRLLLGRFIDFRLFVLHGQIYVSSNCMMVPLYFNPTKKVVETKKLLLLRNRANPLKVATEQVPSTCSRDINEIARAKSINYFVDPQDGQVVAEFMPARPRVLRRVQPKVGYSPGVNPPADEFRDESPLPPPGFYTREEVDVAVQRNFHESVFTNIRGSACCVSIDTPTPLLDNATGTFTNSSTLLMGIGHVKTPFGRKKLNDVVVGNHYLSVFYAFEPMPPYRMVARSGYFCLPAHPTTTPGHALAELRRTDNNLNIAGTAYDCPVIHFVTGMTEKADDTSKLIISYGVGDCTSWFIEVEKAEVTNLLVAPPSKPDL